MQSHGLDIKRSDIDLTTSGGSKPKVYMLLAIFIDYEFGGGTGWTKFAYLMFGRDPQGLIDTSSASILQADIQLQKLPLADIAR